MGENGFILIVKYYMLKLEDCEILEFLKQGKIMFKTEKSESVLLKLLLGCVTGAPGYLYWKLFEL